MLDSEGRKPRFTPEMDYRPCTQCRNHTKKDFIPETWFTLYKREKFTQRNTLKVLKGLGKLYGTNFRFKSYPAFSANISNARGKSTPSIASTKLKISPPTPHPKHL